MKIEWIDLEDSLERIAFDSGLFSLWDIILKKTFFPSWTIDLDLQWNENFLLWMIFLLWNDFHCGEGLPLLVVSNISSWEAHFLQRHCILLNSLCVHFLIIAQISFVRPSIFLAALIEFFCTIVHCKSCKGRSTEPHACCAPTDYIINRKSVDWLIGAFQRVNKPLDKLVLGDFCRRKQGFKFLHLN